MKVLATAIVAAAFIVGCESNAEKAAPAAKANTAPAVVQAPAIHYTEGTVKGRIIVVGSPAAAEKLAAGSAPAMAVTKIGYGPKGETVIFEADSKGIEKTLMAEFDKRHVKK